MNLTKLAITFVAILCLMGCWHDDNQNAENCAEQLNQELERAGRVADFIEFGEIMCLDALNRKESCGAHFREEYKTREGEAKRNDKTYAYSAVWGYQGKGKKAKCYKEPLKFKEIHFATRSYK